MGWLSYFTSGWWLIISLISLSGVIYIYVDSNKKNINAMGWKGVSIFFVILTIPGIVVRVLFSSAGNGVMKIFNDTVSGNYGIDSLVAIEGLLGGVTSSLEQLNSLVKLIQFSPIAMYCGYFGVAGIIILTIAYVVNFAPGIQQAPMIVIEKNPTTTRVMPRTRVTAPVPAKKAEVKSKSKVIAWLVDQSGRNYQLNEGVTTIGRSSSNDIKILNSSTVSRQHSKIIHENGHFTIVDLGTPNKTRVNNMIVREPYLIQSDDVITFGTDCVMQFKK